MGKLWVDYYERTNHYVITVCGHALNEKSWCPLVANQVARDLGLKKYQVKTWPLKGLPSIKMEDVY